MVAGHYAGQQGADWGERIYGEKGAILGSAIGGIVGGAGGGAAAGMSPRGATQRTNVDRRPTPPLRDRATEVLRPGDKGYEAGDLARDVTPKAPALPAPRRALPPAEEPAGSHAHAAPSAPDAPPKPAAGGARFGEELPPGERWQEFASGWRTEAADTAKTKV